MNTITNNWDLLRNIEVTLKQLNVTDNFRECWDVKFKEIVDSMQVECDKKHFSSEVHMLLKKNKTI